MKAPKPLPRISPKKLRALGGKVPFSSITSERKPTSKSGKPRRKKREADEDLRIYGPPEFRTYLHSLPCAVCGWRGKPEQMQQAHAKTGGIGRKDDWTRTLPLCGPHFAPLAFTTTHGRYEVVEGCHAESGNGVKSFEAKHDVNLIALAAKARANYLRESTRSET